MKDCFLKGSAPLFNQLLVFLGIPVKDFHADKANTNVCFMSSGNCGAMQAANS
jgi:hypothetical protein